MEIRKVGILGCGLMGSGIAQVSATAGFNTTVLEVEQKFIDKGFAGIEKSLSKFAERPPEKGGITAQQKDDIRARLNGTTRKEDLADCDIVIEAIIESVPQKKQMYGALDGIVGCDRAQLLGADLTDEYGARVASVRYRANHDVAVGEDPADDTVA